VSKKFKNKEFHFGSGVLFRWVFFILIIYFSINYLSGSKSSLNTSFNPNFNILGVNSQPVIIKATEIFTGYKNQAINFANAQFIDLKKQIVTKVYEQIIKSIDNPKK